MYLRKIDNKKGTEKPIEIFVALFVILAVAMVLLKMFSGQIADKSNELGEFNDRQAALGKCDELCSATKQNDCRTEDLIRFCKANFELDLDSNSAIGVNSEYPYDICEDRIYCPLVNDCTCGQKLTITECKDLMETYYEEEFEKTESEAEALTKQNLNYTFGACEESENAWTKILWP